MGENIKTDEKHSTADRLREQIRHTESDITETVHTLEQRVSPGYLRERGTRKAKGLAWQGTAKLLDLAQRGSVQASLLGASALWLVMKKRKGKLIAERRAMPDLEQAGTVAKAIGAGALWLLNRKFGARKQSHGKEPAVSGLALAATAAKAFLGGARESNKRGTTQPGRKVAWRSVATAIGAALSNYWYSHRGHRV